MKYIFDFDDVLFQNTEMLKPRMFSLIAQAGVPEEEARKYYLEVREKEFSLKKFIAALFERHSISKEKVAFLYEEIMQGCNRFLNKKLIEEVKKVGKKNCYIVTNGENEFNWDKLTYSGVLEYFDTDNIMIVPGTKKYAIDQICELNPNSKIIFIEDKEHFFEDLDFQKHPNLKTILYTGQDIEPLLFTNVEL